MRVLVLAESCNPDWISLPLVGWGHVRALSEHVEVHLVTHAKNREGLAKSDFPQDRITYIDNDVGAKIVNGLSKIVRRNEELSWTTLTALKVPEYYLFEHLAWRKFRDQLKAGYFDVVHRITPSSPVLPSEIAHHLKRIGVPFVLGPLNGALPYPEQMKQRLWQERDLLSKVRGAYRLLPLTSSTRRDASAILLGGAHVMVDVPDDCKERALYLPENGFDPSRINRRRVGPVKLPIRVGTVGRLVPLKGFDLLLRAAAPYVRDGRMTIDMVGGGPEQQNLDALITQLGIDAGVKRHGWVEHQRISDILSSCDVFALPSLKEQGGAAVIEGMATGLVPVVVDYGGPGEVVQPEFGFKVPMSEEAGLVDGLTRVFEQIVSDPQRLLELREKARAYAFEHFEWVSKTKKTVAVYEWVTKRGPRPPLDFPRR